MKAQLSQCKCTTLPEHTQSLDVDFNFRPRAFKGVVGPDKYQNLMYWLIFSMFSDKEIIRILCIYLAYLRDHVNESAYK